MDTYPKLPVIIILAAGSSSRWEHPTLKQLMLVDGKPLIERMVKQVNRIWNAEPYIVTNNKAIGSFSQRWFAPAQFKWTVETLRSTHRLWAGQVIVLLGDTYYTDHVLEGIKNDDRDIVFYGRLLRDLRIVLQ